jgi:hypothetical protein
MRARNWVASLFWDMVIVIGRKRGFKALDED